MIIDTQKANSYWKFFYVSELGKCTIIWYTSTDNLKKQKRSAYK